MNKATIDLCLKILANNESCNNLDITGGAPELNPDLHYLIDRARKLNKNDIVCHNPTVTLDGNPQTGEVKTDLPEYFADNPIEVLASLPYFEQEETDRVRGKGTFKKSVRSLRLQNEQGYGREEGGLVLNPVHNHNGPLRSDEWTALEADFKKELELRYGVYFNKLLTVTNMPINRFHKKIEENGEYKDYMNQLNKSFSKAATVDLACRSLTSACCDGGSTIATLIKLWGCRFIKQNR